MSDGWECALCGDQMTVGEPEHVVATVDAGRGDRTSMAVVCHVCFDYLFDQKKGDDRLGWLVCDACGYRELTTRGLAAQIEENRKTGSTAMCRSCTDEYKRAGGRVRRVPKGTHGRPQHRDH